MKVSSGTVPLTITPTYPCRVMCRVACVRSVERSVVKVRVTPPSVALPVPSPHTAVAEVSGCAVVPEMRRAVRSKVISSGAEASYQSPTARLTTVRLSCAVSAVGSAD